MSDLYAEPGPSTDRPDLGLTSERPDRLGEERMRSRPLPPSGDVALITGEIIHGHLDIRHRGIYVGQAQTRRTTFAGISLEDLWQEPVDLFVPMHAILWWRQDKR